MIIVKSKVFEKWVLKLKDNITRYAIKSRLDRIVIDNNLGEYKHIDGDVFELKFKLNGIRVYFVFGENKEIILLLIGGNKTTQKRDIEKAKKMAKGLKNE